MDEQRDTGRRVPLGFRPPSDEEIESLIRRAREHELGTDFLVKGAQDAVAATFGVHAFLVDAARDRLIQAGA
jgi:hypothetical protein